MNRDNDKGKVLINRSLILGIGKFLLFIVIIARLYYLQVYQADKYKTLADEATDTIESPVSNGSVA